MPLANYFRNQNDPRGQIAVSLVRVLLLYAFLAWAALRREATPGDPGRAERAAPALCDDDGELFEDRRVKRVRLTRKGKKVSFDQWLEIERPLLAELQKGKAPWSVITAEPFPRLKRNTWKDVAHELIEARDGTRYGTASAWFGDAILVLQEGARPRTPGRPARSSGCSPRPTWWPSGCTSMCDR